jgi:hypothetical protein
MIEIDQFLVIGNPEKYVPLNFTKFEDLEKNYSLLHKIHFDNKSRDYLLSMACDYILSKARNRKSVAKKVVYRLIKNSLGKTNDLTIIEKLFEVFKKFAFDCAEDNWKISLFLKDVVLTDQMILWLIENSSKNDLIANRILRYPVKNEIIADWAKVQIDKYYGSISRKSEVIGLALSDVFFEQK